MPVTTPEASRLFRMSMKGIRSACFDTTTRPENTASGSGISQKPILVTMPKFDCEKMPSIHGP